MCHNSFEQQHSWIFEPIIILILLFGVILTQEEISLFWYNISWKDDIMKIDEEHPFPLSKVIVENLLVSTVTWIHDIRVVFHFYSRPTGCNSLQLLLYYPSSSEAVRSEFKYFSKLSSTFHIFFLELLLSVYSQNGTEKICNKRSWVRSHWDTNNLCLHIKGFSKNYRISFIFIGPFYAKFTNVDEVYLCTK